MADESDFQAALDANPEDHTTRLVFADWLEERGDSRAEGYRALGVLGRHGCNAVSHAHVVTWKPEMETCWFSEERIGFAGGALVPRLPHDWFELLGRTQQVSDGAWTTEYDSRRAAEDAAALAFAKLPPERRAELLGLRAGVAG